jgi:hypothetical protein
MSQKTFLLKLTSALVIDGVICTAGETVEVSEAEAKNFLHRGKATLAEVSEEQTDEQISGDKDLMKLTKDELFALAKEAGVETNDRMVKNEIVAALNAAKNKE